jgi:hypothetical protein
MRTFWKAASQSSFRSVQDNADIYLADMNSICNVSPWQRDVEQENTPNLFDTFYTISGNEVCQVQ